ncbi:MAG: hypothetical protein EA388_03445 [Nitriliruptor sp.]|nr:MAG: hypothetical protein EA388_03445 [Nitriliruptor sp.]
MLTANRARADLVPLHDQLVSEGRFAPHQAVACLDVTRRFPPGRHGVCRDTAELVAAALELLERAELTVTQVDGPRR